MSAQDVQCILKIVAVGDGWVGKSDLLTAYINNYLQDQLHKIGGFHIQYNNKTVTLNLWDTSTQKERDKYLRRLIYPNTDVILLCFTDKDRIGEWLSELNEFCHGVPVLLVRTKMDTESNTNSDTEFKEYLRCSSKTLEGIKEVFDKAIQTGMEYKEKKSRVNDEYKL